MLINKKFIFIGLYIITGAIGGFAYYYYVGCQGGACPIQSNPYISTVYGGLLGFVISGIFIKKDTNKKSTEEMES
jgi:hypothetical protein